ncbi:tRNA (adenosine(37)-N6)-threonylcarbamoyltransferase complex dimerization subunit type 1 TsaB [Antarctobacter jejuensis]|uniref:tRNA (adenosine(37)-N6)-threonylcarbamoyltransferase complex dimerization subunit type 1 TsaB n=1 Tax=Antarctobacter jejuensis TaxID=1439938 RepID=UPI003FD2D9C9
MPSDLLVLAFDTSAAHCAAALLCGPMVLASRHEEMKRGQAERLMPLLEELLEEADRNWSDLDAIGVGIGPGNFTGIRISVSAARGLALGLGIPAVGVSILDALALDAGFVLTAVEAPRGTLYSQIPGGQPVQSSLEEMPLPPARAEANVIGHRAEEIAARTGGLVLQAKYPLAEAIARKAMRRMHNVSLPRPAPLYIRPADAAPSRDTKAVILDP